MEKTVDLNTFEIKVVLKCPYCSKGKSYSYVHSGLSSSACSNCGRIVLWDFDNGIAYKANQKRVS